MRAGPCLCPTTCPLMPQDPLLLPHRVFATLHVLGVFIPPCFCTHCSCFLECSYSISNGQIYTSSKMHLYYPFSVKPIPQLYPTLECFPRISRFGCIWLGIFQLSVSGVQR